MEGREGVDMVAPLYRARIAEGALAFPDLYVVLTATEEELRRRRAGDPTRTRRNFEKHLLLAGPLRRYFEALRGGPPQRVAILGTGPQDGLVGRAMETLGLLSPGPPDSLRLLDEMAGWLRLPSPAA